MNTKCIKTKLLIISLWLLIPGIAWAIPNLQIYIPGAVYDMETETWIIESYDYDLMIVGANLAISDVKIAIAVPEDEDGAIAVSWVDGEHGTVTLTESDGMKYQDYWDSYYSDPGVDYDAKSHDYETYAFGIAEDGAYPTMGDGAAVPGHGVFPTDFYEYYIGDLAADAETVYNYNPPDGYSGDSYYIDDFSELDSGLGDNITLHIIVKGYSWADIVAYNHVEKTNGKAKYVFSPFSHDGAGDTPVPEPATLLLLGFGLLGLSFIRRRRK